MKPQDGDAAQSSIATRQRRVLRAEVKCPNCDEVVKIYETDCGSDSKWCFAECGCGDLDLHARTELEVVGRERGPEPPEFKWYNWCYLRLRRHDWDGDYPEPGWATKQCRKCGVVAVCGM